MGSSCIAQGDQVGACVHLEEWDRESGRAKQEGGDMGIYVYVQLIHFIIQQKLHMLVKQLYSNKDV